MQKNQFLTNSQFKFDNNIQIKKEHSVNPNLQRRLNEKQQLIKILAQKNQKLHKQIKKIQRIMNQNNQKQTEKSKEQLKRQNVIQTTSDPDILNRQLNNCYKKIKLYQYEVDKLKQKSLGGGTAQKVVNMQAQLKQKKLIQDRLKQQLNTIIRQIAQNSKKLSGGFQQQQIQRDLKSKSDQLKVLKQMIKEYESKQGIKQKNLKTEYNYIKKIQKQYIQNGGQLSQLENIKQKAVNLFQEGRLKQVSKDKDQNYYQKFGKNNSKSTSLNISTYNISTSNPQIQVIEDRTKTHYESLLSQFQVLEKLNKKYQKQLDQSDKTMKQMEGKSELTKKRLEKLQKDIQEMNSSIKLKKTCIVAQNMRPAHKRSLKSVSTHEDFINVSDLKDQRRKRNIVNLTAINNQ